jgi:5-formyltetrahydrofolate cyclo-ligase
MNPDPIALRKAELRKAARSRRRMMRGARHAELDRRIGAILVDRITTLEARCVAGYMAFDGEPELHTALQELAQRGLCLALPVLDTRDGAPMKMRRWWARTKMRPNRYGIPEPVEGEEIPGTEIDIILMPLVAYDTTGTRLGMGSAYYDRYLHELAGRDRPLRVGVAYAAQQLEHIPRQPWDVPMHALANENGWFSFTGRNSENAG